MRRITCVVLLAIVTACSSTSDPLASGDGAALVEGLVIDAAGTPRSAVTVRIDCLGSPALVRSTDSTGTYSTRLSTNERTVVMTGGQVPCRLQEPSNGATRASLTAIVGFAQGPVFLARQRFDLREP